MAASFSLLIPLLEQTATPQPLLLLPMRLSRFAKHCKTNQPRMDKEASS